LIEDNEYWRFTINRCTARPKTSTVDDIVQLISSHAHSDTVQILCTACKRIKSNDRPTACERPVQTYPNCFVEASRI